MKIVYDEAKEAVVGQVSGSTSAITTDLWTSLGNKAYITVTCHMISGDWKLRNILLATRGVLDRHTGTNIAQHLTQIVQEFNIGSVAAIVTDNAKNMVIASAEAGYPRVACFSHTLQLCVNDGLKQVTITRAIAFAKRLNNLELEVQYSFLIHNCKFWEHTF